MAMVTMDGVMAGDEVRKHYFKSRFHISFSRRSHTNQGAERPALFCLILPPFVFVSTHNDLQSR